MSSPLDDLRRQRALVHEHLQWLDREIARAAASAGPIDPPAEKPAETSPAPPLPIAEAPGAPPDVAELDSRHLHNEVRRGCFLYAAIAAAALTGLVAFIFWKY